MSFNIQLKFLQNCQWQVKNIETYEKENIDYVYIHIVFVSFDGMKNVV